MSSLPPAKRARHRQACEPCRRKKTRCPGEKPTCSFCARLGQFCNYEEELARHHSPGSVAVRTPVSVSQAGDSQPLEDRVEMLEAKLVEVLEVVSQQQVHREPVGQEAANLSTRGELSPIPRRLPSYMSTGNLPPWDFVVVSAKQYLLYCDCQPLPLFHRQSFISSLPARDPEVLFSVLALALRFSENVIFHDNLAEFVRGFAETARSMVMQRISEGRVELSTLQSLCLLSLVDFSHGYQHRASIHMNLAMNLAHCAGLNSESRLNFSDAMLEERRRCFWGILILKRLHYADVSTLDYASEESFPNYPMSTGLSADTPTNNEVPSFPATDSGPPEDATKDAGLVAYAIQLSEVWFRTTRYARRRGAPSKLPPWSPQSDYAIILAEQMDFETHMPYKHRFKPAGFSKYSVDELQQNRDYWGPWLFIQFLYHTNLCLLNHPLILALRLRNIRSVLPEIFLQNTSDLISSHTSWIIHLINMLKAKSFQVTDPFLGHCAAIVATIHLQESFAEDPEVRKEKATHFSTCLDFIVGFGQHWPHMARLAGKLQQLHDTVSTSYHHRSSNSQSPTRSLLIDLARFWEILEYSSASGVYESAAQLFGPSLYFGTHQSTAEVSNTSTLPPPTRLGSSTPSTNEGSGVDPTQASGQYNDPGVTPPAIISDSGVPQVPYGFFNFQPYSNDELAVLADSLFSQRQDFAGDADDWWKTGNL